MSSKAGYLKAQLKEFRDGQRSSRSSSHIRFYSPRVRKYIGAYAAVMGSIDAVIFTVGIDENNASGILGDAHTWLVGSICTALECGLQVITIVETPDFSRSSTMYGACFSPSLSLYDRWLDTYASVNSISTQ
jgi:hypothetical protein